MLRRVTCSVASAISGLVLCMLGTGCLGPQIAPPVDSQIPRELQKASLPAYVIEPPDVLLIDAIRVIPLPPYHIEPLDLLLIQVSGIAPGQPPIEGVFAVESSGNITLGIEYGSVHLAGLTTDQARAAIEKRLQTLGLKEPKALVSLAQSRALQQIRGEHLVRPDGMISLGTYGTVYVSGMTTQEARTAIEEHLGQFLEKPEISLDVGAYNSKVYYIVTDGGGFGETLTRLPYTGNETVLDAISLVNGLPAVASKRHIWVARPAPANCNHDQILPVDWRAVTECGRTATNYQLMPGDRIFVKADALITADNWIAKLAAPIERVFGVTLLGNETVRSFRSGTGTGTGSGLGF